METDPGRGPLKTQLHVSWEMSLPRGEGSLENPNMLSESEAISEQVFPRWSHEMLQRTLPNLHQAVGK